MRHACRNMPAYQSRMQSGAAASLDFRNRKTAPFPRIFLPLLPGPEGGANRKLK